MLLTSGHFYQKFVEIMLNQIGSNHITLDQIGLNCFKLDQLTLKHDLKRVFAHGFDKHGFDKHGQEKGSWVKF